MTKARTVSEQVRDEKRNKKLARKVSIRVDGIMNNILALPFNNMGSFNRRTPRYDEVNLDIKSLLNCETIQETPVRKSRLSKTKNVESTFRKTNTLFTSTERP